MRFSFAVAFAAAASAAPFSFPLPNGFPVLSAAALKKTELQAGGTLPNTPLPTSIKSGAHLAFQVVATNEIFEVAYFTDLLRNITDGVPGYTEAEVGNKTQAIEIFTQIRAQEELHATGANAILATAGFGEIKPCEYIFPVDNYADAVALASTFTDLVLGTLQSVQQTLAEDGGAEASGLVPLVASIIGQEAEQDGAYRFLGKKVPSAAPFLTGSVGQFAFNAVVQNFIVPGSCPSSNAIDIPAYKTLSTITTPMAANMTLEYTTSETDVSSSANSLVYMSGQNFPVVVSVKDVVTKSGVTTFCADFPFDSGFAKGLTVAALVKGKGPFKSNAAVADATVAGPGLIEVD